VAQSSIMPETNKGHAPRFGGTNLSGQYEHGEA
jgi:hypothetical protein